MPPNSVAYDMPHDEYAKLARVNWSSLRHLAKSPAQYRHNLLNPPKDTASKKLGRCGHLSVLEPERYETECIVWTGGKRYGSRWDKFQEDNAGFAILTVDEDRRCRDIAQAVRNHAVAGPYFQGGDAEVSVLWTCDVPALADCPATAFECKGRLDFVSKSGVIVDLKTTRDASPEGFARSSWNYRYHVQAAMYRDGWEAATGEQLPYVIVAVESEAPYVVSVFRVPEVLLQTGRDTYRELLHRLALCRHTDSWGGYVDNEEPLGIPRWAGPSAEEDIAGLDLVFGETHGL